MLTLEGIEAGYGSLTVLKGIDLEVRPGEIVALLGANGAGKSTLLKGIVGLVPITAGRISFVQRPITGWTPERIVPLGISLVPEGRRLFAQLRVRDNLLLGAYHRWHLGRGGRREIAHDLEGVLTFFPVLRDWLERPARVLSGGMQQMLAIARGLMARPRLLLLDEPSMGLSPLLVEELLAILVKLKRQGVTVLLVEQNTDMALEVADRVYVLRTGQVVRHATPEELGDPATLPRFYLGGG